MPAKKPNPHSKHPLYGVWYQMIYRCYNPNCRAFPNYGGRGVKVTNRWRFGKDGMSGFEMFVLDMKDKPWPQDAYGSLDRIDNHGNYNKNNCRWATPHQQSMNRRAPQDRPVKNSA